MAMRSGIHRAITQFEAKSCEITTGCRRSGKARELTAWQGAYLRRQEAPQLCACPRARAQGRGRHEGGGGRRRGDGSGAAAIRPSARGRARGRPRGRRRARARAGGGRSRRAPAGALRRQQRPHRSLRRRARKPAGHCCRKTPQNPALHTHARQAKCAQLCRTAEPPLSPVVTLFYTSLLYYSNRMYISGRRRRT